MINNGGNGAVGRIGDQSWAKRKQGESGGLTCCEGSGSGGCESGKDGSQSNSLTFVVVFRGFRALFFIPGHGEDPGVPRNPG